LINPVTGKKIQARGKKKAVSCRVGQKKACGFIDYFTNNAILITEDTWRNNNGILYAFL
jgi:hypothetical protein